MYVNMGCDGSGSAASHILFASNNSRRNPYTTTTHSAFVVAHVAADIWLLSAMKTVYTLYRYVRCVFAKSGSSARHRLLHARTVEEYMKWAEHIDKEEGLDKWRCVCHVGLYQGGGSTVVGLTGAFNV